MECTDEDAKSLVFTMKKMNAINIKAIYMSCTWLTDKGVAEFCQLGWLKELDVSQCKNITDNAVSEIAQNLIHLERLIIMGNRDITNINPLKNIKSLTCLDVSYTKVKNCDLEWIRKSKLKFICIHNTQLTKDALHIGSSP